MTDWKERANKRRDERHTKTPEMHHPSPAKKDTKKWCKGKVGREHTLKVLDGKDKGSYVQREGGSKKFVIMEKWRYLICTTCGKELDVYYGHGEKPDWLKK